MPSIIASSEATTNCKCVNKTFIHTGKPYQTFCKHHWDRWQGRAVVVASGGWLLTSVADLSDDLGGGRTALVNPGNRELLLASVAWLAGRRGDPRGGLSGREVPRIESLGDGARRAWAFGFGGVLSLAPLAVGAAFVGRRRMRA